MSYYDYPASPEFVQPGGYNYHNLNREVVSGSYYHQAPRYVQPRHASHNFDHYQDGELFSTSFETHSNPHGPRHVTQPYPEPPVSAYHDRVDVSSSQSSSPTSTSDVAMSRHASSTGNSPRERHVTAASLSTDKPCCTHKDCLDENRHPTRSFSRKADLQRHTRSTHEDPSIDCPWKKCTRKGPAGFTRMDHCTEHRRQYHDESIEKRGGSGGRREGGGRHSA